ncbi:unnamed protein product [Prunus armeniaca]|uniref:Uncharacterized protein n=1 Tax=Prunus armeniaca TaxID=36596 RepID=A0A6J5Y5S0_PRUAR|nr:unnamed protein product [Prunus armeniaca]
MAVHFTLEADESRLREVCESFLGPPTGMVEDTPLDPKNLAWDPYVLGMRKHKLLREDILPAMASNRKVQRLLNEFMDLISEYESAETNLEKRSQTSPTARPPAADQWKLLHLGQIKRTLSLLQQIKRSLFLLQLMKRTPPS